MRFPLEMSQTEMRDCRGWGLAPATSSVDLAPTPAGRQITQPLPAARIHQGPVPTCRRHSKSPCWSEKHRRVPSDTARSTSGVRTDSLFTSSSGKGPRERLQRTLPVASSLRMANCASSITTITLLDVRTRGAPCACDVARCVHSGPSSASRVSRTLFMFAMPIKARPVPPETGTKETGRSTSNGNAPCRTR